MRYIFIALVLGVFTLSCNKQKECGCVPPPVPDQSDWMNAKVIETDNIDCHQPLIQFESSELTKLQSFTGRTGDSYLMLNLPSSLNQLSKRIQVRVIKLPATEDSPCTTLGISYPKLRITDARGL